MQHIQIFPEYIIAEVTSADIANLINKLVANGISLEDVRYTDALTVRITLRRQAYLQLVLLADKYGASVRRIRKLGLFLLVKKFLKRPVMTLFSLLVFLLACYVPGRVFFLSVEGNVQVPDKYILEVAERCGIGFGAKRRLVRSEIMKNQLLESIPQLQWAGINTYGCTAVISVREKTISEEPKEVNYPVSRIVASRDGIIQSCTVFQGSAQCVVGQAVKAGQILVSGYLDCGIIIKTTRAEAEIKALTVRDLTVVSPAATAVRGELQTRKANYSLKIGKNLIKFYKDSGNLDTTCGKIYSEEYVCLPGGFRLPIAIVKEDIIYYDTSRGEEPVIDSGEWLKDFAESYLKREMISGEIISENAEITANTAVFNLWGRYTCSEMIGRVAKEEIIPKG